LPASLPYDHPNLVAATSRLRRNLWIWAALFLAMAALVFIALGSSHILRAVPWIVGALLFIFGRQPAYLALASIFWGLELIHLVPGAEAALGPNPLSASLGSSPLEILGYAVLEAVMLVTAWNQFMFYRMLYGTQDFSGLDPESPLIPEVVPNRTARLAWTALTLALLGVIAAAAAIPLARQGRSVWAVETALGLSEIAMGLGLGVAFSPTTRRRLALAGTIIGAFGFAFSLAINQALGGSGA
jgi:hypothetical protein